MVPHSYCVICITCHLVWANQRSRTHFKEARSHLAWEQCFTQVWRVLWTGVKRVLAGSEFCMQLTQHNFACTWTVQYTICVTIWHGIYAEASRTRNKCGSPPPNFLVVPFEHFFKKKEGNAWIARNIVLYFCMRSSTRLTTFWKLNGRQWVNRFGHSSSLNMNGQLAW